MKFDLWVLEALAQHGRLCANEILGMAKEVELSVSLGTIYVTMERYVERGYITEEVERRIVFWRITNEGHGARNYDAQFWPMPYHQLV